MDYKFRFTVFTATYNRGELLWQVYRDLCNQTFKDFEWVIVDDGSTDNTENVCKSMIDEGKLNIVYKKKGRDAASGGGGKHTAWKVGTTLFRGRYVFCADDDDVLVENSLEILDKNWKILEAQDDYEQFAAIKTRCVNADTNELIGPKMPDPWFDTNWNEILFKLNMGCEMDGCHKVEILRNEGAVPDSFPYQDKCTNYGEMVRWCNVARKYKMRILPNVTRKYILTEDSLCRAKDNKPSRSMMYNNLSSNLELINKLKDVLIGYKRYDWYIKSIINTAMLSFRLKESSIKYLSRTIDKVVYVLMYIPSLCILAIKK